MSGELAVSFAIKLNDSGSPAAVRALQTLTRALKETEGVAKTTSQAAITAFQKLATAREILGIRSEKAIQNEIRQTEAAYQRLVASGTAGARELARAQDAMRQKVGELRRELEGVNKAAGGGGGMPGALRNAMSIAGAWQAGKMVLQGPVGQTMAYDRQLANLSNTAYAGQSLDARRTGMRTLDAAIVAAVRNGGGTREGALGTLDKLVASGAYSDVGEAASLLPTLTRAGTGANADPALLADIAIRGKQTFGLTNTSLAIDQAIRAGQLGGFELKDMAKWLPQQMAMARQSGLMGDDGFRTLLAANQAAAITAGSKDEAGNNLVNLLAKINSQDTANDAKKLGIDLAGSLAAARGKGVNSLDAFVNLTEQVVGKDTKYQALREKAKTTTGDEQRATYAAMGDILQGSAIGKIVQDRQALMALIGIMNNRAYMNNIRGQLGNAGGAADDAFGLIAETPSYKAEQLAAEKAIAMQAALDKVNPALGSFAEGLTGLMRDWPAFTAAIVGASTALFALAAAAGAASIGQVLGGGAAGGAGRAAGRIAGAIGSGGAGLALRAGGMAAAPLGVMWGVSEWAGDTSNDQGRVSALQGGGSTLSKWLGYLGFNKDADIEARRAKNREGLDTSEPVRIENKIILDGRQVAESVNEYNARQAGRN